MNVFIRTPRLWLKSGQSTYHLCLQAYKTAPAMLNSQCLANTVDPSADRQIPGKFRILQIRSPRTRHSTEDYSRPTQTNPRQRLRTTPRTNRKHTTPAALLPLNH